MSKIQMLISLLLERLFGVFMSSREARARLCDCRRPASIALSPLAGRAQVRAMIGCDNIEPSELRAAY